jgi:hypothetical protein
VTNEGCNAANGEACDTAMNGFQCYTPPPPNSGVTCGMCDDQNTACVGGDSCLQGQCAKYCCDDGDCGSGTCDLTLTSDPSVGLCVVSTTDGGAGGGDAGTGGAPGGDAGSDAGDGG